MNGRRGGGRFEESRRRRRPADFIHGTEWLAEWCGVQVNAARGGRLPIAT